MPTAVQVHDRSNKAGQALGKRPDKRQSLDLEGLALGMGSTTLLYVRALLYGNRYNQASSTDLVNLTCNRPTDRMTTTGQSLLRDARSVSDSFLGSKAKHGMCAP